MLDGKLEAGGRNLGITTIQVYDRMEREKRALTKSRTVSTERSHKGWGHKVVARSKEWSTSKQREHI